MRNHMHYPSMGMTPRWTPIGTCSMCSLSQKCRAEQAVPEMHKLSMWPKSVHPSGAGKARITALSWCSQGRVGNGHSENTSPEYHEEADRQGLATWGSSRPRKTLQEQNAEVLGWSAWQFAQFPEVFPSFTRSHNQAQSRQKPKRETGIEFRDHGNA